MNKFKEQERDLHDNLNAQHKHQEANAIEIAVLKERNRCADIVDGCRGQDFPHDYIYEAIIDPTKE